MKPTKEGATRASIGIVAGSGPEAEIDLWSKVLTRNQMLFGRDPTTRAAAPSHG